MKMQEISNYDSTMHEATGGKAKKDKVYACGQKLKNQIVEVLMNAIMKEEKIRMINVKNGIKKVGAWISPILLER